MARRTIYSSSETSNKIISIKALQQTIKSSRAKVRKFHTAELLTFSNNLHEAMYMLFTRMFKEDLCNF